MFYAPFDQFFPKIAEKETRNFTVFDDPEVPTSAYTLPSATYTLVESYCAEPGCDCQRVFFSIFSSESNQMEAVVAYGWETTAFYARWMGSDDPDTIQMLKGPILNQSSPQSQYAPALLNFMQTVILKDKEYVNRLRKHYNLFKSVVDQQEKKKKISRYNKKMLKQPLGFQPDSRKRK